MSSFNEVEDVIAFFRKRQKEYTSKMDFDGNITYMKFDLRDILDVIPQAHVKPLINFYLKNSDAKTLKDFTQHYHEYYKSLVEYAKDRRKIYVLKKKTMERINEQ